LRSVEDAKIPTHLTVVRFIVSVLITVFAGRGTYINHIQRVTIVTDDNVIEQVTDFKYLGYRISEYKSDLESKLKHTTKLTELYGDIEQQMNKERKLRIYNIAAKAVLQFGSEAWVLKEREEQHLKAAQIKFLKHLLGITKLDKERNQCVWEKSGAQNIVKEVKQYKEKWLQHVQRMDTNTCRIPKQALQYKPKGRRNGGRSRKSWRDQLHIEDQQETRLILHEHDNDVGNVNCFNRVLHSFS
jgi:hypothetical protein